MKVVAVLFHSCFLFSPLNASRRCLFHQSLRDHENLFPGPLPLGCVLDLGLTQAWIACCLDKFCGPHCLMCTFIESIKRVLDSESWRCFSAREQRQRRREGHPTTSVPCQRRPEQRRWTQRRRGRRHLARFVSEPPRPRPVLTPSRWAQVFITSLLTFLPVQGEGPLTSRLCVSARQGARS